MEFEGILISEKKINLEIQCFIEFEVWEFSQLVGCLVNLGIYILFFCSYFYDFGVIGISYKFYFLSGCWGFEIGVLCLYSKDIIIEFSFFIRC